MLQSGQLQHDPTWMFYNYTQFYISFRINFDVIFFFPSLIQLLYLNMHADHNKIDHSKRAMAKILKYKSTVALVRTSNVNRSLPFLKSHIFMVESFEVETR